MRSILLPILLPTLLLTACVKDDETAPSSTCGGTSGTIHVKNTSLHTVQRILINGANCGSLDPGEEAFLERNPGNYTVRLQGISGGEGCSAATLHVAACTTEGLSCSY